MGFIDFLLFRSHKRKLKPSSSGLQTSVSLYSTLPFHYSRGGIHCQICMCDVSRLISLVMPVGWDPIFNSPFQYFRRRSAQTHIQIHINTFYEYISSTHHAKQRTAHTHPKTGGLAMRLNVGLALRRWTETTNCVRTCINAGGVGGYMTGARTFRGDVGIEVPFFAAAAAAGNTGTRFSKLMLCTGNAVYSSVNCATGSCTDAVVLHRVCFFSHVVGSSTCKNNNNNNNRNNIDNNNIAAMQRHRVFFPKY